MENQLTNEEKKAKYNLAIEVLEKATKKFNEEMKVLWIKEKRKTIEINKAFDLEEFWKTIQNLKNKALEWETDLLKTFVLLKRIESWVKFNIDELKDLAYNQYIDRQLTPRDEVAFGYGFSTTIRKTINYKEDKEYAEISEKLKNREKILKNAVDQSEKNNTVVDENGEIIEAPSYSYSSSLTIKKV